MANAAAAPAAAIKELSLFWPSTATLVDVGEVVLDAVLDPEPDEPVVCVMVELSQTTELGMSVTPPIAQIFLAASMVSVDDEFPVLSLSTQGTYSVGPPWSTQVECSRPFC